MFAQIFGKELDKQPPPKRVLPPLKEFSLEIAKKWEKFLAPANLDDMDRCIDFNLRVRPLNDAELACEEKRLLSYKLDSSGKIISFGELE